MANDGAASGGAGHEATAGGAVDNTARLKDLYRTMVRIRIFVKGSDR